MSGVERASWYMPLDGMYHACPIGGMVDTAHLKCVALGVRVQVPHQARPIRPYMTSYRAFSSCANNPLGHVLKSRSWPSYVPYRVWCGELDTVIWCEHVTTCTLSCNLRMPCWNIAFPTVEPVDKPCVRMVLRGESLVIDNTFPKIEWNQAISTKNVGIPTFLGCG